MTTQPLILYDIPRNDTKCKSWSSNCWKARFTLNYKGLPYITEWVEYPDITRICKELNARPTSKKADGTPQYTLPMIYDPFTETVVVESSAIAKYLDATYPHTPQLFTDGFNAYQTIFLDVVRPRVAEAFLPITLSRICGHLNEPSASYFRKTREAKFGKKLEELKTEDAWKKLEDELGRLKSYFDANGNGRDLLLAGNHVTFCDLQIASWLKWAKLACGEDSGDWRRILGFHGGFWARFAEQFTQYEVVKE